MNHNLRQITLEDVPRAVLTAAIIATMVWVVMNTIKGGELGSAAPASAPSDRYSVLSSPKSETCGAPVPEHLFPVSTDPVVPGTLVTWEGNDTVWTVTRVEADTAYIRCADGTGEVYPWPAHEIRTLQRHK